MSYLGGYQQEDINLDHSGKKAPFNQFDLTFYAEVNGDPASDGKNPSFPSTLESLLINQQQPGMLIIAGLGTHLASSSGSFTITSDDVTVRGRLAGVETGQVIFDSPLNLQGNARFVAQNITFASSIEDTSEGQHRFEECGSRGSISYNRPDPRNFVEFLDCILNSTSYNVSGVGGGGTVGGGDTFLTGATDIGNCQLDTQLHFFSARSGTFIRRIRAAAGVFAACVLDNVVTTSGSPDAVQMPAGLLVAGNSRFNGSTGLGSIEVSQHWLYDCIFNISISSLGAFAVGLGPAFFSEIFYNNSVSGLSANTVQGAIDELSSSSSTSVERYEPTGPSTITIDASRDVHDVDCTNLGPANILNIELDDSRVDPYILIIRNVPALAVTRIRDANLSSSVNTTPGGTYLPLAEAMYKIVRVSGPPDSIWQIGQMPLP